MNQPETGKNERKIFLQLCRLRTFEYVTDPELIKKKRLIELVT